MAQGSLNPKNRFLGQKVCVAHTRTHRHTDRQNDYCGHSFRVSGFFPFNLSSRVVPIKGHNKTKKGFFLMCQGSLNPKLRFLAQKLWSVARVQRHRQTHTKVNTEGTLSGFQEFSFNLSSRIGPIRF